MSLQFNRLCRIGVRKYNDPLPRYFDQRLNISAAINKTSDGEFNFARVAINNLSRDSQQFIENAAAFPDLNISKLTIEVGYDPVISADPKSGWEVVFNGDLLYAESNLFGVDSVTTLEGGEGARAYQLAFVNKSFGPTTLVFEIFDFLVKSFELFGVERSIDFEATILRVAGSTVINPNTFSTPNTESHTRPDVSVILGQDITKLGDLGINALDVPPIGTNLLNANIDPKFTGLVVGNKKKDPTEDAFFGLALYGYARDFLDKLCARHGLVWFIDNNVLEIIGADEWIETGLIITPSNGLIGSPIRGPNGQVQTAMLIRSNISPYKAYNLESKYISGKLRARRVYHALETRGDAWVTNCENDSLG